MASLIPMPPAGGDTGHPNNLLSTRLQIRVLSQGDGRCSIAPPASACPKAPCSARMPLPRSGGETPPGRGCGWSLRRSGWAEFRAGLSGRDLPLGPGWSSDRLALSPALAPQSFPPNLLHRWIAHALRSMAQEHQHLGGVELIHRGWRPRNPHLSAECFALALRRLLG
jgi:hypothetical protein